MPKLCSEHRTFSKESGMGIAESERKEDHPMKKIIAVLLVVASIACTSIFATSCKSDAEKAMDAAKDAASQYLDALT